MRSSTEPLDPVAIAIAALSHFATDAKTLSRFFALTGLDPQSLREAAASPGFAAGILDFVLQDERLLVEIAQAQDTTPEAIAAARHRLEVPLHDDDWPPRPAGDWA